MHYDIIITGGGAAGLSFISHLLQSDWRDKRVLLLEAAAKDQNDRTWCYWAKEPLPYAGHRYSWKALSIRDKAHEQLLPLHDYRYFELNSLAFYQAQYAQIAQADQITLQRERVTAIVPQDEGVEVRTLKGCYTADWVVNSIPKLAQRLPQRFGLTQNFKGWRIHTEQAVFNPGRVVLMDFFDQPEDHVSFYYVLPYSQHSALIEYTRLSEDLPEAAHYEESLQQYLQKRYGLTAQQYEIQETEEGVIPMTDFRFERQPHARIFQLGTVGGSTKPTTGYTFYNIQQEAQEILAHLQGKSRLPKRSERFHFYDGLLLKIMRERPQRVPEIMQRLFKGESADPVLKFLDQKTYLWQDISLFWRLPWGPFLRALTQKRRPAYAFAPQVSTRRPVASPLPRT